MNNLLQQHRSAMAAVASGLALQQPEGAAILAAASMYMAEQAREIEQLRDKLERAASDYQSARDYGDDANRVIQNMKADRDRLKARVAELGAALRQHLHTNRACSHPVGSAGSTARRAWEDQCEADRVAIAALAQETIAKIRAKQAAKPKGSALPIAMPAVSGDCDCEAPEPASGVALVSNSCQVHNLHPETSHDD